MSSGEEALLKVRKEVCFGIGCGYIYFFFDQCYAYLNSGGCRL